MLGGPQMIISDYRKYSDGTESGCTITEWTRGHYGPLNQIFDLKSYGHPSRMAHIINSDPSSFYLHELHIVFLGYPLIQLELLYYPQPTPRTYGPYYT